MRCPDCQKFVGNEQAEPELTLDVDDNGNVTGDVRLVLQCADCGTELAESNQSVDIEVGFEHAEGCTGAALSISEESAENQDRYDGKPGTPPRYRRHYYGAEITGKVTCAGCSAEASFTDTVEEQAGGFDQLN